MVIIIGGGLAGLTCARTLQQAGVDFQLLETGEALGGRLRTTVTPDGFHLDHGFQVLLNNYPAVRRHLDLEKLLPHYFDSGAILANGQDQSRVWHFLHHPTKLWESAVGKYATWSDKLLLGKLAAELLLASPEKLLEQDRLRISTRDFLEKRGFSPFIVESFFRPFFGGVLLDNNLSTSASLFQYYFQKFILGNTLIPAKGIQEIPRQLAARLPEGSVQLGVSVEKITRHGVQLNGGRKIAGSHIILATAAPEAARLLKRKSPPPPRRVTVAYFASNQPVYREKLLVLPAGKHRLVRHFAQVTNVAPTLAPAGRHLLSATILDRDSHNNEALSALAHAEISAIYPAAKILLEPLAVIDVPYAVPTQLPRFSLQQSNGLLPNNVHLAGDHTLHGSVQGAMESGEKAAFAVLKDLRCG